MFKYMLAVVLFTVSGFQLGQCSECCKTGYNYYTWCSSYCCDPYPFSTSIYNRCCSSYSSKVWINTADSSDCRGYFANNVWAAVLIGLGSLAVFIGFIVCCVCCVKGCTTNNSRTGAVVVNPGQQGTGMFVVNSSMAQQGQQQQPQMYGGAPMQPGQAGYPPGYGQAAYPPGYAGPSNAGLQHPPPYTNPGFEKAGGVPPS